ncbi:MAG: ester cyclase [Terriglobales bacterium]|jgi:predicted ester cyclase
MPRDENVKAVQLAAERFNAKNLEGYLELYDSSVLHHGFGNIKLGVGGLREHFQHLLRGFPNLRIDSQDIFGDDEKVAHRYTFYGTHQGEYMGYSATNKFVIAPGVLLHSFERGKCVEVWHVIDNTRFLAIMGVIPALPKLRSDAPPSARR